MKAIAKTLSLFTLAGMFPDKQAVVAFSQRQRGTRQTNSSGELSKY